MRPLLLLLCLYLPAHAHCQKYTIKRPQLWVGIGSAFVSGTAWGLHEKSINHPNEFFNTFPNASRRIWGPDSWRNKYVNGDPEQGRIKWGPFNKPVQLTDAKHALATITQVGLLSAGVCVTIGDRRPWWNYALDLTLVSAARSAGNYLTFNALYH